MEGNLALAVADRRVLLTWVQVMRRMAHDLGAAQDSMCVRDALADPIEQPAHQTHVPHIAAQRINIAGITFQVGGYSIGVDACRRIINTNREVRINVWIFSGIAL